MTILPVAAHHRASAFVTTLLACLLALQPVGLAAFELGARPALEPTTAAYALRAVVLPDGDVLVSGSFQHAGGQRRNGIARLDASGTARPGFDANCRGVISAGIEQPCVIAQLLAGPGDSLFVAGYYAGFAGREHAGIAKLSRGSGELDASWRIASPADAVLVAAIADQLLLRVDGGTRLISVSISGNGAATPGFTPIAGIDAATPIAHDGSDAIYYVRRAGAFQRVVRAHLDSGATDTRWSTDDFGGITALVYLPGSDDLVIADSSPTPRYAFPFVLARVRASGSGEQAVAWGGGFPGLVRAVEVKVGGEYLYARFEAVSTGSNIMRFELATGSPEAGYRGWQGPGGGGAPQYLLRLLDVDASGRPLTSYYLSLGTSDQHLPAGSTLQRVALDGQLDDTFRARVRRTGEVFLVASAADGVALVHGHFSWTRERYANRLVRTRGDAVLDDPGFARLVHADAFGASYVTAAAQLEGGHALVATASFDDTGWAFPAQLRQFDAGGDLVSGWSADGFIVPDGMDRSEEKRVDALLVDEDAGWLYVAGKFDGMICGQRRRNLARVTLESPCRADPDWNPDPDGQVLSLAMDQMHRLYVGGAFTQIGDVAHRSLARFQDDALDADWQPLPPAPGSSSVRVLATIADRIFAVLDVAPVGGETSTGLLRIDTVTGAIDPSWQPVVAAGVRDMVMTRSGRLVVARFGVGGWGDAADIIEDYDPLGTGMWRAQLRLAPGERVNALAQGREDDAVLVGGRFGALLGEERPAIAELLLESRAMFANGFE